LDALRLTGDVQTIVSLAIGTGMRRSEIINMRWPDIKLKNRTLYIPQTKTDTPRTILLSSRAVSLPNTLPVNISERVLEIAPDSVSQAFKRACKRANKDNLRFHDCRHEAVTRFFALGLNVVASWW
jgi:integrase